MACYAPRKGHRNEKGQLIKSCKWNEGTATLVVPCGQCVGCRNEYARQWALRIMHEATLHEANSFITLTYDEKNLPKDRSLDLRHWQKFAKRLRKNVGPFRFYHCGEYGDRYGRPHYHACIFGLDFAGDRRLADENSGFHLFNSPTLTETWGLGTECMIGDLTFTSAAYVARYCMKKMNGRKKNSVDDRTGLSHYERCDTTTGEITTLRTEYATMSRRPGIGQGWIEKWMKDVYPRDFVIENGHTSRVPRYYDGQFELKHPGGMEKIKKIRIEKAKKHEDDQSPERLRDKAKVAEAKQKLYRRTME